MTPKDVLVLCREKDVKAVDLRFTDFVGQWQHTTIPVSRLKESSFDEGYGIDGSSMRGWQTINESDLLIVPQPETAFPDPFASIATLNLICQIQDPITREEYSRDPRNVARKAVTYLSGTGIADRAHFAPECEFFVFDDVRFDQTSNAGYYSVDGREAPWNRGSEENPNLGHKIRQHEGYMPCPPADQLMDLRTEMMLALMEAGIQVECHHHEVASPGQLELDFQYSEMVQCADNVMLYKYVVKNVARKHGMTATFMPKPIFGANGSGMHTHLSLWKGNEPLFAGKAYAGLSDLALYAIGGILKHAPAILAFSNASTNSYRRLVPGYDAPINLSYSQRNRSSACRIPMVSNSPKSKRIEFRCPDGSANPYFAFAAILMAAIDGIQNKVHPGPPMEKDIYDLPPEELRSTPRTPSSLDEALICLESDQGFLLRGEVFSEDLISRWIDYKRKHDVAPILERPHPFEFCQYYDC